MGRSSCLALLALAFSRCVSGFKPNTHLSQTPYATRTTTLSARPVDNDEGRPSRSPNPPMSRASFFKTAAALTILPSVAQASKTSISPIPGSYGLVDQAAKATSTASAPLSHGSSTRLTSAAASESSSVVTSAIETTALQESISGFFAGAALTTTKTLVKYPLDTATVRLQVLESNYTLANLFRGSYNGATLSLLSNIPGGAVFFAVKDSAKAILKQQSLDGAPLPKWLTTSLAVAAAQVPYWAIRNPSEVVKVRQQAAVPGYGDGVSAWQAVKQTLADAADADSNTTVLERGKDFYLGYWENIAYAYPADVIKFVAYEAITGGKKDLPPVEGARAGAAATAIAQFLTTPLDVVRNRLMSKQKKISDDPAMDENSTKEGYFESLATIAREEGLPGLFSGASPRVGKAVLSGAIQFATYEETKQKIAGLMLKKD